MKLRKISLACLILALVGCSAFSAGQQPVSSETTYHPEYLSALEEEYSGYLIATNRNYPNNYYNIICCWEIDKGDWRCGIFTDKSSDRKLRPFTFMQQEKPCTLETMSDILYLFYDNTDPNLYVAEIDYPITESNMPQALNVSTNKFLYDKLSLTASYVYNVKRWQ